MTNKGWKIYKIDNICEVLSSKRIFAADYVKFGIPFYRSKEIIEKAFGENISNLLYIAEEKYNDIKSKYGVPKENDILISAVGERSGIPYLVRNEEFYFKDGNLIWIRNFDDRKIFSKYLCYWFKSKIGQFTLENLMIGSAQKALTIVGIKGIELNLPPLEVQNKIAKVLSALDNKIELNNAINNNLEQQAQAIFKSWFVDNEYEIEKETTIGEACKCELGGTPSRNKKEYWDGSIAWINSGTVNNYRITKATEYITELGLSKSATKLLPKKTTVLAITGATLGQISLLEIDSCANQSVVGILENEKVPYEFIYPYICHNIHELLSHQTGGAQQHINKQNIEQLVISLPKHDVICKYKKLVNPIYSKITNNCFENEQLAQLRDALLPKLMSGEIDVSNVEIDKVSTNKLSFS